MSRAQAAARFKRFEKFIIALVGRLEDEQLAWTDLAQRTITRQETEALQKFINDHRYFPEIIWDKENGK